MTRALADLSLPELYRQIWATEEIRRAVVRRADPLDGIEDEMLSAVLAGLGPRVERALAAAGISDIGDGLDEEEIFAVLAAAAPHMTDGWAEEVAAPVAQAIGAAYDEGREDALDPLRLDPEWTTDDAQALDGLARDTGHWISNAWTGAFAAILASLLRAPTQAGVTDAASLRDRMVERCESYVELCAGVGAVRARNFGALSSFRQSGVRAFRFRAVIDRDTSRLCRALHGRVFRLAAALDLRDEWLGVADPEAAKGVFRWPTREEVAAIPSMSDSELADNGWIVPPLHGGCRSELVPVSFDGDDGDDAG